jgi:hypothetical protein
LWGSDLKYSRMTGAHSVLRLPPETGLMMNNKFKSEVGINISL